MLKALSLAGLVVGAVSSLTPHRNSEPMLEEQA